MRRLGIVCAGNPPWQMMSKSASRAAMGADVVITVPNVTSVQFAPCVAPDA